MRRLILNADDLGLTRGVNRAISECLRAGAITSATLMANSRHFDEAASEARVRGFPVGCHVMLVDGAPLAPARDLPTLAPGGVFRPGFGGVALAALRNRVAPREVQAETEAQFRRLLAVGIQPTHFDTHKHTHMLPQLLRPMLAAARACGVRAVRNPFAPLRPLAFAHLARRPHLWTRYSEVRLLRGFAASFRRAVAEAGLRTTDGTLGVVVTGALDLQLFRAIVGNLPEGTWEFVCHPGYCDDELRAAGTRLLESRDREMAVLTSAGARDALRANGVELITYREL